jgi:flavin reductase (DIM6/NTAB) family NADH-FMN oxidoreductase RutF/rubredoxin
MFIIASKKGGKFNGQIANTVLQVTGEPLEIMVSINRKNLTYDFIKSSGVFTASILSEQTPMTLIGTFGFKSGRDIDKFKDAKYRIGVTGAPIVTETTVGYFEAEVVGSLDCGAHTIFVGKVVDADILKPEAEPMTYSYYHTVKKGLTPKTAATYIKQQQEKEVIEVSKKPSAAKPAAAKPPAAKPLAAKPAAAQPAKPVASKPKMAKYKCVVCGYIYDPEKGDPESGVKPETPFEKLPADWVCPVCGAAKTEFEKLD